MVLLHHQVADNNSSESPLHPSVPTCWFTVPLLLKTSRTLGNPGNLASGVQLLSVQFSPLQPSFVEGVQECLRCSRVLEPRARRSTRRKSGKTPAGTVPRLKVVFSYAGSPTHSQKVISEVSWGIYLGNMPLNNLGPKAPTDHLLQEVARDGPVVPCGWQ